MLSEEPEQFTTIIWFHKKKHTYKFTDILWTHRPRTSLRERKSLFAQCHDDDFWIHYHFVLQTARGNFRCLFRNYLWPVVTSHASSVGKGFSCHTVSTLKTIYLKATPEIHSEYACMTRKPRRRNRDSQTPIKISKNLLNILESPLTIPESP